MNPIPDAALAVIRAATEDAWQLDEDHEGTADRVIQYLISSGWRITPDIETEAA